VGWARADGVGRLVEEDRLDPRERLADAVARWRWRRVHGVAPGSARAVFLAGVQRSGTNMVVRGLEGFPEFEVHNENDRRVYRRFQLRDDQVVRKVVTRSKHRYVLFKPLCDSHRIPALLDDLALWPAPRAIWAYRNVDDRVRSAVAKFGDVNRRVLAEIASGRAPDRWQAQRLSADSHELIRRLQPETLTIESAAALFWLVRNRLFFDLGLDRRDDVHLVSYDGMIREPETTMRALCEFLDLPYDPRLVAHVDHRSRGARPQLNLHSDVRAACVKLQERLDAVAAGHLPPTV
jgi:hypothetical protein